MWWTTRRTDQQWLKMRWPKTLGLLISLLSRPLPSPTTASTSLLTKISAMSSGLCLVALSMLNRLSRRWNKRSLPWSPQAPDARKIEARRMARSLSCLPWLWARLTTPQRLVAWTGAQGDNALLKGPLWLPLSRQSPKFKKRVQNLRWQWQTSSSWSNSIRLIRESNWILWIKSPRPSCVVPSVS